MTMEIPDLPFKTGFQSLDNFRVHYTASGSGPPLILVHGGGTWMYSFRHNITPLSRYFSVYALDMPGHGYTRAFRDHTTYDFDTVCDTLLSFMNSINLKNVSLAGHSWGGGWVICFAEKYPDRVDKIVLIDSSGMHRYDRISWELMKYPFLEKFLMKFINQTRIKKGLEACFYDRKLVNDEMVRNTYAPLLDKKILNAQLNYSRNINWKKTKAALPRIRSEALLIWGENDRYIRVNYGREMERLMKNACLEIIPKCGHSAHEEHPRRVNQLISDFIG